MYSWNGNCSSLPSPGSFQFCPFTSGRGTYASLQHTAAYSHSNYGVLIYFIKIVGPQYLWAQHLVNASLFLKGPPGRFQKPLPVESGRFLRRWEAHGPSWASKHQHDWKSQSQTPGGFLRRWEYPWSGLQAGVPGDLKESGSGAGILNIPEAQHRRMCYLCGVL